jgi:hypothetical protein
MSREKKVQVRVDENDERCIDINMKLFKTTKKSEAMRKSSQLTATLKDYFQENGSLEVLDKEGGIIVIMPL